MRNRQRLIGNAIVRFCQGAGRHDGGAMPADGDTGVRHSFHHSRQYVVLLVLSLSMIGSVGAANSAKPSGGNTQTTAKSGEITDPTLIKALKKKTLETERLRKKVKELEALLRMKTEISKAKSKAIEELEAAKGKK